MSEEISPAVMRRWVRNELRRRREKAGLDQKDAAEELRCAPSRVSHLEKGRNLPDKPTVVVLFTLYRCSEDIESFWGVIDQIRKAEKSKSGKVHIASDRDPNSFDVYADLEDGATHKYGANLIALDGLVQVGGYSERLLRFFDPDASDEEIIRRRDLRQLRQGVLTRERNPLRLWVVIAEHLLDPKYCVGGSEVLVPQLKHLLELSRLPNVEIQVLPGATGGHAAVHGPFAILKFPIQEDPGVVYIDGAIEGTFYEELDEIRKYEAIMNHLQAAALDQRKSKSLIDKLRKEAA